MEMTRKEAIENIRKHFDYMQEWITPKEVLKVALEALKQPEIVRCKDCKWAWNINPTEEEKFYVCKNPTMVNMRYSHKGDWFCANGERQEGR